MHKGSWQEYESAETEGHHGSTPRANALISDRKCFSRARHRTRSSHWLGWVTGSRSFLPHTQFDRRGLRAAPLVQRGEALGAWAAITWDPHRFQPPFVERFVEELAAYSRHSYPGRGL